MTRTGDETLSLSDRSARVQACENVQALITIHTNAAPSSQIEGIETFCHQPHLFNTTFYKGSGNLYPQVVDFYKDIHTKSYDFAQAVHANVLKSARKDYKGVVNRKVKHKVSQLLLSATVPSILVELGFLTHPYEKILLQCDSYQDLLAEGIVKGVEEFFESSLV